MSGNCDAATSGGARTAQAFTRPRTPAGCPGTLPDGAPGRVPGAAGQAAARVPVRNRAP